MFQVIELIAMDTYNKLSASSLFITNCPWILLNDMFYFWIQCLVQVSFAYYSVSAACLFELKLI